MKFRRQASRDPNIPKYRDTLNFKVRVMTPFCQAHHLHIFLPIFRRKMKLPLPLRSSSSLLFLRDIIDLDKGEKVVGALLLFLYALVDLSREGMFFITRPLSSSKNRHSISPL
jgi:hypothetical protein